MTACVKGTNGDPEDKPPDSLPDVGITEASSAEGDAGTSQLTFSITLTAAVTDVVSIAYETADGTATAGSDYVPASGTLDIPAGATEATITVLINGDTVVEDDETLAVGIDIVSANATLTVNSATGTIVNDDISAVPSSSALNDTGVTTCSTGSSNDLTCNSADAGTEAFPGQDAEYGRDTTDNDDNDGHAGFVFTKLDDSGSPLSDQAPAYDVSPWSCVQDEVTGLVWEVKTADGSLRDKGWTYSWYNSTGINDGGDVGVSNAGKCADTVGCDTEKFVGAINAAGLCGFTDWRLPKRGELISLVHFGATAAPYIDTAFFPNTAEQPYWTSSIAALGESVAYVSFSENGSRGAPRKRAFAVRLVRGQ